MSEKKNIDRLFQEKFKDFEVQPPEMAWQNIESGLQKKKRQKKVVPLWLRLSGVAAILLLGLMLSIPIFNSNEESGVPVALENKDTDGGGEGSENTNITPMDKPIKPYQTVTENGNEVVVTNERSNAIATENGRNNDKVNPGEANTNPAERNNKSRLKNDNSHNAIVYEGKAVVSSKTNANNTGGRSKTRTKIATTTETGVAHQSKTSGKKGKYNSGRSNGISGDNENNPANNSTNTQNAIATGNNQNNGSNNNVTGNDILNNAANKKAVAGRDKAGKKNNTGNGESNGLNNENEGRTTVANNNRNTTVTQNQAGKDGNNNPQKVAENNTGVAAKNSPDDKTDDVLTNKTAEEAIAQVAADTVKPVNELEELLKKKLEGEKEKDEELLAEADAKKEKWNIKPQLAPLFYNSMSQGSPIDEQFAGNSKEYDNDLSYGVGVNYALTERISIRTGVNTVNLSYKTNDIQFYAALDRQTSNIAASTSASANIVVQNAEMAPSSPVEGIVADQLVAEKFSGSLVQKMGFIEVPLEMSYKLLNKRFGIDIIGGVSTLFLNDNSVSVISTQGLRSDVGEAENLNNIHFSTNIGVGFKYRFWKSFEANFEPMFKYQVNTFSNNAGNFKPYFIGLYSGLSFSF